MLFLLIRRMKHVKGTLMTVYYLSVTFIIYQCMKKRKSVTADAGTLFTPQVNLLFYKYSLLRVFL